jgi:hypothetical protein
MITLLRELGSTGALIIVSIYITHEIIPSLKAINKRLEGIETKQEIILDRTQRGVS